MRQSFCRLKRWLLLNLVCILSRWDRTYLINAALEQMTITQREITIAAMIGRWMPGKHVHSNPRKVAA